MAILQETAVFALIRDGDEAGLTEQVLYLAEAATERDLLLGRKVLARNVVIFTVLSVAGLIVTTILNPKSGFQIFPLVFCWASVVFTRYFLRAYTQHIPMITADTDPTAQENASVTRYQTPSRDHLMGTDRFGRDVWSRVVYGARVSLGVALLSVLLAAMLGTAYGAISGISYFA